MLQWYVAIDRKPVGPMDWSALVDLASRSVIHPQSLVWSDGMDAWAPACTVDGLFQAEPAVRAPVRRQAANSVSALPYFAIWLVVVAIAFMIFFWLAGQNTADAEDRLSGACLATFVFGLIHAASVVISAVGLGYLFPDEQRKVGIAGIYWPSSAGGWLLLGAVSSLSAFACFFLVIAAVAIGAKESKRSR